MATLLGTRFLNSVRLKSIIETLSSELVNNRPLIYLDMIPVVQAFDDEIMGRFTGNIIAADIIADDQEAVVQESGKIEMVTHAIPNLKIGQRVGQAKLNLMNRLENGQGRADEEDALDTWENMIAENLVTGVRQRMNALCCAMLLDAFTYDRLGIKISGATWGMPAALKVTPSIAWTTANAATMVPISDMFSMDQVATDAYGVAFDTAIMSTARFRKVVASTEFKNLVGAYASPDFIVPVANQNTMNTPAMLELAGKVLNKTIVLDDATYAERTNEGQLVRRRYLPDSKVILIRAEDRNDNRIWDFANGVVTESIVGQLIGQGGGLFNGGEYGPIGYYTGRPDLNPPDVVAWAVARGFPRKHIVEANAVLTVE